MGKYFLGSVGMAEAFRRNSEGKLELAFVSKTLTDSGLNIQTTKDDIRAGTGAPIQFSFYHDSTVEVTLTDVLWKKEYLEAQIGANFKWAETVYDTFMVKFADTATEGKGYLLSEFEGEAVTGGVPAKEIKEIPFSCDGTAKIAWGTPKGKDDWVTLTIDDDGKLYAPTAGEYCIRYLTDGADYNAKAAEITATIVPEELVLIVTAPIFAGDACAASKGEAAGRIVFEVPRFQLNGAQEFAMNMSQNQTMSLAGQALASAALDCNAMAGKLIRIIEVITNETWEQSAEALAFDDDKLVVNQPVTAYAIVGDDAKFITNPSAVLEVKSSTATEFTACPATWATAGEYTVRLKNNTNVTETVTVSAS